MAVLLITEHDGATPVPAVYNALTACAALGGDVCAFVAGPSTAAEAIAKAAGVGRVLHADDPSLADGLAENLAPLITSAAGDFDRIVFPATAWGKNIAPRVAALLDVAQITDVIAVDAPDTFKRPIYAGNAIATVRCADPKIVMTIRSTAFDAAAADGGSASVDALGGAADAGLSAFVGRELTQSDRPELTSARVVVSGGRGLQDAEHFKLLESLADRMGAAVGASRAAVDAGYAPNDYQVGQTGKVVAPDLYIAVGISGAIQHLAGMKDSKVIVAINKDEEAPIFQVADYGLVADLFEAVPAFDAALADRG